MPVVNCLVYFELEDLSTVSSIILLAIMLDCKWRRKWSKKCTALSVF